MGRRHMHEQGRGAVFDNSVNNETLRIDRRVAQQCAGAQERQGGARVARILRRAQVASAQQRLCSQMKCMARAVRNYDLIRCNVD
ncbi:hypothetical protein PTKU46_82500 [Paraburkholderia terrae]